MRQALVMVFGSEPPSSPATSSGGTDQEREAKKVRFNVLDDEESDGWVETEEERVNSPSSASRELPQEWMGSTRRRKSLYGHLRSTKCNGRKATPLLGMFEATPCSKKVGSSISDCPRMGSLGISATRRIDVRQWAREQCPKLVTGSCCVGGTRRCRVRHFLFCAVLYVEQL